MKKTLLVLLALLLVATVMVACGKEKVNPNDPTSDVSAFKAKGEWTTINDPLSWEGINSFMATDEIAKLYETDKDAAIAKAREVAVAFFRYSKTALWMANEDFSYWHMKDAHDNGEPANLNQLGGVVCGGVPYIYVSSGSIYRLMDYMDPATNVVNMADFAKNPHLYGNQCSIGSYWGWARVINSAKYDWTQNMVEANGFLRVGDYEYDPLQTTAFSDGYRTTKVLEDTGVVYSADGKKADPASLDRINECYALLKAGDGIVYYTSAGHVVMISQDAVVVRDPVTGKIDPEKSYVLVIDQTPGEIEGTNEAGDGYIYQKNVDAKWTFQYLANGKYVPFTYKEFTGEDPIEKTECTLSHEGETITVEQMLKLKMTSNYGISDLYVSVYNADGVEVFKAVTRATQAGKTELKFTTAANNYFKWGDETTLDPANYEYTVKVYAQLGTGARPVLWEGKLAA